MPIAASIDSWEPTASITTSAPPESRLPTMNEPVVRRTARASSFGGTDDVGAELLGQLPLDGVLGADHDRVRVR